MTATATATARTLPAVRAELLDCVQSNLAVLADRHHGPGTHLALGATLRFSPVPGPAGLPTVEPPLERELAAIDRLGLVERHSWTGVPGGALGELAREHGALYVMADSFAMPWLPYHGHAHMEHSFLVEPTAEPDRLLVTDAYDNYTPWGVTRPLTTEVAAAELPVASLVALLEPLPTGAPTVAPGLEREPPDDYLAAYAQHPDRLVALERLTVETWLLARSRGLHAAFRAHLGLPEGPEVAAHLARWGRVAEQAYLALRRVQRGRPEPQRLREELAATLAADGEVFAAPVASAQAPGGATAGDGGRDAGDAAALRAAVAGIVASVTRTTVEAVLAAPDLTELTGFDSFRVVEIVERLEEHLDADLDPEDLVPENLHRLDDLCRLAATTRSS
ncbi:acyl carrier protein [Streptomyces triticirhizae]|uniref:Acyl carrier protein n=1 Tax=Streptomyces triticirhizae TaxID=2483353 RepID=A0A3M2LVR2_9ACTN|nr:acyl carrier protein [Streptomyces triticirhizae]RMI40633.1 acyl carrier protein [Streptomyces triticirhizae]